MMRICVTDAGTGAGRTGARYTMQLYRLKNWKWWWGIGVLLLWAIVDLYPGPSNEWLEKYGII